VTRPLEGGRGLKPNEPIAQFLVVLGGYINTGLGLLEILGDRCYYG
jgi:hypothetical protein